MDFDRVFVVDYLPVKKGTRIISSELLYNDEVEYWNTAADRLPGMGISASTLMVFFKSR